MPLTSALALAPSENGKKIEKPESGTPRRRLLVTKGEHAEVFEKPDVLNERTSRA